MSDPKQVVETIDIENAGNAVSARLHGATLFDLVIEGDAAADYAVDIRKRNGTWFQSVGAAYSGSANYDDVREHGAHEVRVRCTTGTATAGDSATIAILAGGG